MTNRRLLALSAAMILFSGLAFAWEAPVEKKEFKGELVCTKCELKETQKCGHCLIVVENKEKVKYYLDDKGAKEKYHEKVCTGPVCWVCLGFFGEKDGKKILSEVEVEIQEAKDKKEDKEPKKDK